MLSAVVELLALVCFVVAGWLVAPALGLAVAGGALLLVGHALDTVELPTLATALEELRQRWHGKGDAS